MPDPAAQAAQAGAPPQGATPPGSPPATTPVPNRGQEAAGLAMLSVVLQALLKLASQFGPGSDVGKAVIKASNDLAKHVPAGSTSPGVQNNAMMEMQRSQQAQQPMAAMMAARGAGGAAQQQPGAAMAAQ